VETSAVLRLVLAFGGIYYFPKKRMDLESQPKKVKSTRS